ncbi:SAM-dependent methyltransferase [Buchnera aphidicola (Kurisakia onigurumii)]|uniref:RlmE family RNA methyltransferase n=1 Tax=Buchnera aphidicola TaxID=9 RepID=UPI0031B6F24F
MNKKNRSKSSSRWLREHFKDPYVNKCHLNKLRSRAWFKLKELDSVYSIFKKGMHVLDLGSSPGSWSQYAIDKIKNKNSEQILACDLLPMKPITGVHFFQGDITKKYFLNKILIYFQMNQINVVMSDMSPNLTGISSIDIPKSIHLSNIALKIAIKVLHKKGFLIIKSFQGIGLSQLVKKIKNFFKIVKINKPNSSRSRSNEIFIIANNLQK